MQADCTPVDDSAPASRQGACDAMLAALRERGAARRDPVRFCFVESLARRAGAHHGATRHVLYDKLEQRLQAFGRELDAASRKVGGAGRPGDVSASAAPHSSVSSTVSEFVGPTECASACAGPLAGLVLRFGRPAAPSSRLHSGMVLHSPGEEHAALDYLRRTWARLSADQRLAQSLSSLPENAGPLHSHHLVHRSLTTLRELSPAYLERFVAYVDALLWLEQAEV